MGSNGWCWTNQQIHSISGKRLSSGRQVSAHLWNAIERAAAEAIRLPFGEGGGRCHC